MRLLSTITDMTHPSVSRAIPSGNEFNRLRESVGWHTFHDDQAAEALRRGLYYAAIRHERELVAFGWAVGDGLAYVYFQDIMVAPAKQRMGLGTAVVNDLIAQASATLIHGGYCGLLAVGGMERFYHKFGFKPQTLTNTAMGYYVESKESTVE
jgi:GNAT superfamily N-acetyltransferase